MRIITATSAREQGITRGQLYGPRFRRLFHGVHVDADVLPTLPVLVAGARAILPDATVTGITALRLRGATIGSDSPVQLATRRRVTRDGIVTIPVDRPSDSGIATLADAFDDAGLGLLDEVVTLDELRRLGRIWSAEQEVLAERRAQSWRLSVANAASVPESRTRMVLHTAGLPTPRTQYRIPDEAGRLVGRVDLAWPEHMVIVEYEGQQHLTNSEQWEADIRRYETLERLGWNVIRVTAATLRDPLALVVRVHTALRSGGWRGPSPVLDAAWLAQVV